MPQGDFSVVLPIDGNIISAPVYNPGPSPIDAVLGTVSQGIKQFSSDMDERARKKKEAKEEAEKERQKKLRGELFDGLRTIDRQTGAESKADPWAGFVTGVTNPETAAASLNPAPVTNALADSPVDPAIAVLDGAVASGIVTGKRMGELEADVTTQAESIQNIDTAINQGTMPSQAKDAAIDRLLLDLRNRFPDVDVEVIVSMMDKMGIKTALAYNIDSYYADMSAGDKSRRDYIEQARTTGLEIYGEAAVSMTQEQIIAGGMNDIQRQRQLADIQKNLEIQIAQANLTEKQRELAEKAAAKDIARISTQSAMETFAPLVNSAQSLIDIMGQNPGGNPALEEQFRETMGLLKTRIPTLIQNYKNEVLQANGTVEQANEIGDYLTKMFQDTVITPLETRDNDFLSMVKTLETNLGLKTSEAFPTIAMMKSLGINLPLADLLMGQLDGPTQTKLAEELKGISTMDMYTLRGRESAQAQLLQVISVLEGDTTLNQLNLKPEQLEKRFKEVDKATRSLGRKLSTGDMSQQDAWLNGMAETAIAAEQLSRGSSLVALGNAVSSLTGNGAANFRTLMSKSSDPEKAQLVALGARAGVARAMEGLKTKPKTYGFYSVRYSKARGKWEVQFNQEAWKMSPASRGPVGDPMDTKLGINRGTTGRKPEAPGEARLLASSLNNASDFLVRTSTFDEGAPKGTEAELRAWFNEGKMPKSMVRELQERKKKDNASPMEALNEFERVLQDGDFSLKVPDRPAEDGSIVDAKGNVVVQGTRGKVTIESIGTVRSKYSSKPLFKQTVTAASKYGVPEDVALVLAGHEGKFNPKAEADAGKGRTAWGPMQIVDTIHNAETLRLYGKKVKDLSPQQNIDYGMRLLAENYKATGNWKDAMAMYHSGVSLSEATRQGRSDGNIRTADYIRGLASAAGMAP